MTKIELFEKPPNFETYRLHIRRLSLDDVKDYFEIFTNENVTRYYDVETMTSVDQAKELIEKHNQFYENKWSVRYALYNNEDKKTIGTLGLYDFKENQSIEIGFDLNYKYWKKGYMTETLKTVISFIFNNLNIQSIYGGFLKPNIASENIMKRLLFSRDKVEENIEIKPNVFETVYFYKLTKDVFDSNGDYFKEP